MISIIVPVYNVENYLSATIESILNQSYGNFEVIIVNDGSSDSSGAICDKWALMDRRIRVIHKNNGGLSSARNAGIEVAQGDYVAFIDSDDLIETTMLEEMSNILDKNNEIGIVSCGISTFIDGSQNMENFMNSSPSATYSFYEYYRLILQHKKDNSVCNKIYRKNIIGDTRFCEGRINEDILFNADMLMHHENYRLHHISKPFYLYRLRHGSITRQANPKAYDFIINALEIKTKTRSLYGNILDAELDGYICYEIVNFISTIEKYKAKHSFLHEIKSCKRYLGTNLWHNYTNKYWPLKSKLKSVLVISAPAIYRLLLNIR